MWAFIKSISGKIGSWLPQLLVGWYFSPKRLAKGIVIDIARYTDFRPQNGAVPELTLYFNIINFNDIPVTLERMLVEVFPHVEKTLLERVVIPPRSIGKAFFKATLTSEQLQAVQRDQSPQGVRRMSVNITPTFESKFGLIQIERFTLEQHLS